MEYGRSCFRLDNNRQKKLNNAPERARKLAEVEESTLESASCEGIYEINIYYEYFFKNPIGQDFEARTSSHDLERTYSIYLC